MTDPKPEIVKPSVALAPANAPSVYELLRFSMESKASVEQMERLLAMQERLETRAAAAEFRVAFARFQGECPPIKQDQVVDYVGKSSGIRTNYTFASLAEIARTVNPILGRCGLSYKWESSVTPEGVMVVTCIVSHTAGHSERAAFGLPAKGGTDKMSEAQQFASSLTYAKRQSLVQALGLTTTEDDVDGQDLGEQDNEVASAEQVATIEALLTETNSNRAAFLAFAGVKFVADIRASAYPGIYARLLAKRGDKK